MAAWRSIPWATLFALEPSCWWPATPSSAKVTFAQTQENFWKQRALQRSPALETTSAGKKFTYHTTARSLVLLFLIIPRQPAIHEKCRAGGVIGVRGRQKHGHGRHIFRLAQPLQGNVRQQGVQLGRVIQQLCVDGRFDGPWSNVVDGDSQRRKLDRQIARQHFHAAFAGAIGSEVREGKLLMHGADVDDLAASLGQHAVLHECLSNEENAF